MESAISRWILIFLAKQRGINCSVFKSLLSVLPLPDDDILLKKVDLLCRISVQIDEDTSITDDMLNYLEVVEELDYLMGVSSITASLVKAYCAVAVECTARYLPGKVDQKSKYFDALERIWRGRIRLMEQAESDKRSGLLTDELLLWRDRFEAALTNPSVRCHLLEMNIRTEAFRVLKAYLDEELEDLLPLFIEVPSKNISACGNVGGNLNINLNHRSPPSGDNTENFERHVPVKTTRVLPCRYSRGVIKADADELEAGTSASTSASSGKKRILQATHLMKNLFPESQGAAELPKPDKHYNTSNLDRDDNATEMQKRPQSSNLVKGLLPDPHKVTESPAYDKHKRSSNLEQDVIVAEEQVAPTFSYLVKDALPAADQPTEWCMSDQHDRASDRGQGVSAAEEQGFQSRYLLKNPLPDAHKETDMLVSDRYNKISNPGKNVSASQKSSKENNASSSVAPDIFKNQPCGSYKLRRYNLRNHNDTARTHEWEESEGLVEKKKANPNTRPLIIPNRKRRRWSPEEEDTLRAGVQKFGEGQWKLILDCYSHSFAGRSSKDLKDKWRNLLHHHRPKI